MQISEILLHVYPFFALSHSFSTSPVVKQNKRCRVMWLQWCNLASDALTTINHVGSIQPFLPIKIVLQMLRSSSPICSANSQLNSSGGEIKQCSCFSQIKHWGIRSPAPPSLCYSGGSHWSNIYIYIYSLSLQCLLRWKCQNIKWNPVGSMCSSV